VLKSKQAQDYWTLNLQLGKENQGVRTEAKPEGMKSTHLSGGCLVFLFSSVGCGKWDVERQGG
jgi:hypothetical protein